MTSRKGIAVNRMNFTKTIGGDVNVIAAIKRYESAKQTVNDRSAHFKKWGRLFLFINISLSSFYSILVCFLFFVKAWLQKIFIVVISSCNALGFVLICT